MIRKFVTTLSLIFAFGLAAVPVMAQDFDVEGMEEMGLEGIHARLYISEAALTGGPGIMGVMVVGIELADADTASEVFELLTCSFAGGMLGVEDEGDCEELLASGIEVADIDGIGAQAIEIIGSAVGDEDPMPMVALAVQSEQHIFVVIYLGDDTSGVANDFGTYLADAEAVDTEVVFDESGNASGGFFDMLPPAGDPVIEGLMAMQDMDIASEMGEE